jgi:hypothetical protein
MACAWAVQQRTVNSGWVDTIWTFALGLVGAGSALWPVAGPPNPRQWRGARLARQFRFTPPRDRNVYGNDTALWMRRWRSFYLATRGAVRLRRRQRMERQPLLDEGGVARRRTGGARECAAEPPNNLADCCLAKHPCAALVINFARAF